MRSIKLIPMALLILLFVSCGSQQEKKKTVESEVPPEAIAENEKESPSLLAPKLPNPRDNPELRKKTIPLSSLEGKPCEGHAILYAYQNIDSLSTKALDIFLKAFSTECHDNVEFSEFSNEMIFEVFARYPQELAYLITRNDYEFYAIWYELKGPLLDPDVRAIMAGFEEVQVSNARMDSLMSALKSAQAYLKR